MKGAILYFLLMLFLHVFADYNLQGILASMKQKDWWQKQIPNFSTSQYRNDYKAAMIAHSYMWGFVVTIPMSVTAFIANDLGLIVSSIALIISMSYGHYVIDDLKANRKTINLITDQIFHFIQLVVAWICWTVIEKGW